MTFFRAGAAPIVALALAGPTPVQAFEPWQDYQPPAISCGDHWISLPLNDGRGCLQVSGDGIETISNDTQSGVTFSYSVTGRLAVIVDDSSGLAGVVGARAQRSPYWSYSAAGVLTPDHDHLDLTEVFVTAGRGLQVRAGLLDATFDSLAARKDDFDWLTDLEPLGNLYAQGPVRRGGIGAQVIGDLAGSLSAGVGVEDLGGQPFATTALGYLGFNDGKGTEAKVTGMLGGLADGRADNWSVEGYAKAKLGVLDLLTTAMSASDGTWRGSLSGRLTLGEVFVAAGAEKGNGEADVTGSVHVGDPEVGASVGVAGRLMQSETFLISQLELQGSILPIENMQVRAAIGTTEAKASGAYPGPIQYGRVTAIWRPTDMVQLTAQYTENSLGGWKVAGTAEQRF